MLAQHVMDMFVNVCPAVKACLAVKARPAVKVCPAVNASAALVRRGYKGNLLSCFLQEIYTAVPTINRTKMARKEEERSRRHRSHRRRDERESRSSSGRGDVRLGPVPEVPKEVVPVVPVVRVAATDPVSVSTFRPPRVGSGVLPEIDEVVCRLIAIEDVVSRVEQQILRREETCMLQETDMRMEKKLDKIGDFLVETLRSMDERGKASDGALLSESENLEKWKQLATTVVTEIKQALIESTGSQKREPTSTHHYRRWSASRVKLLSLAAFVFCCFVLIVISNTDLATEYVRHDLQHPATKKWPFF